MDKTTPSNARPFGKNKTNKASKNPRDNIGDHRVCYGTVDEMNDVWANVRTEDDMREFYKKFFPAYPDQLIEAVVHTMRLKLERVREGNFDPAQDLFNGSVVKADKLKTMQEKTWDYKTELKQQMTEGQLALAAKRLEELSVAH